VTVSFVVGVAAGGLYDRFIFDAPLWLTFIMLLVAASLATPRSARMTCFVLAALLFGFIRYNQTFPPPGMPTVSDMVGREVVYAGHVVSEVIDRGDHQDVTIGELSTPNDKLFGRLLVRMPTHPAVFYGDQVALHCRAEAPEPINGFRYDRLLLSRSVMATCAFPKAVDVTPIKSWDVRAALLGMKHEALHTLGLVLPEPHASFVGGLLFGGSSALGSDLRQDFSRTGISHVMAASGYNVAIFSSTLLILLMRSPLGRRRGLGVSALVVLGYVLLAGATAPVVRAGAMAALAMLGTWLGREHSLRNVLALTAAVMLLQNPRLLLDDVGFQLSFAATIAIVVFADHVAGRIAFVPDAFGLRKSFAASLAAIACTTPIILWHFGTISLIAPLANFLVLPWVPYLMLFGALALLTAAASTTVGLVVAIPAWGVSVLLLTVVRWFSAIPFSSVDAPLALAASVMSAVVLLFLCRFLLEKPAVARA
jgi:competence protein ComEC